MVALFSVQKMTEDMIDHSCDINYKNKDEVLVHPINIYHTMILCEIDYSNNQFFCTGKW